MITLCDLGAITMFGAGVAVGLFIWFLYILNNYEKEKSNRKGERK